VCFKQNSVQFSFGFILSYSERHDDILHANVLVFVFCSWVLGAR